VENSRLAKEYEIATTALYAAVEELHEKMGTSPQREYAQLDRVANEARV
jgi:hypothetical protein